jgi:hypothetical protein
MTPLEVLNTIRQAGGRVVVLDGDLQVVAPPGTVSPEAAAVLREHKAGLLGILPDAEREAVRWVEDLAPAAAEPVVEAARQEWEEIVVATMPEPVLAGTADAGSSVALAMLEPSTIGSTVKLDTEPADGESLAEPVEIITPEGLVIRFAEPVESEEIVEPDEADIFDEDREYMYGPRRRPRPCSWCGGRLQHNPLCCELTWEPKLRFGKHKGKPISQVPATYLRWLVENVSLRGKLKSKIEQILKHGNNRSRSRSRSKANA